MTIEFALTYLVTSIGIDANMSDSAALEVLSSISSQLFILVVLSLILSVGLSGGVMIAFKALASNNEVTPYQALFNGIKKFFPLLLGNLMHSLAYGIGFLLLVLPGFFLYARLGLFPLYIMFEDKKALDALGESWQATDEVGTKLFVLTSVFLGIQIIFGLVGGLVGIDSSIGFLVLATLIKYATMMPLFYLFFSLYQSLERTQ
ncbi:hypothetical protein N9T50_00555 [Pseudomonadota bacterium]|jgi:hypothetical protein|nr:hypothetical protein [Pseudomonadota bacterium]MDA9652866.1 hypothetical protein [Pseudomonadota bacterium]MDC1420757.1 hypothetical protein [Gammaproteobacteria bacterium]